MRVLIVQNNLELGQVWARFLEREGMDVTLNGSQEQAIKTLRFNSFDALVLELVLPDGGAIAIADFATYKNENVSIITVTLSSFFSDGSIFSIIPNARGMLPSPVKTDDLAAMLTHYNEKALVD